MYEICAENSGFLSIVAARLHHSPITWQSFAVLCMNHRAGTMFYVLCSIHGTMNHGLWINQIFLNVFTFACGHIITPLGGCVFFDRKLRLVCCEYCSCKKFRLSVSTSSIQNVDWKRDGLTWFCTKGILAILPPVLAVSTVISVTLPIC